MKNLLVKLLGPLLAIAAVLGLTGSSILWNFQGRTLGLPATVISLLALAVGIVLLRPLQPAASAEISEIAEDQRSEVTTIDSTTKIRKFRSIKIEKQLSLSKMQLTQNYLIRPTRKSHR